MGFFDGGSNPADAAMPYLNKIEPMEHQNYDPFINQGKEAYGQMNPILSKMMQDPASFLEMIMKDYNPSKSFQLKNDEMLNSAGNSAAAGGMRGSINDINNEAHITDSLLGDDMQTWLKNVLGIQDTGMAGEGHFYDNGYDATKNLTSDLSNVYGTQGQLAFQGQANQNQSQSDMLGGLMKMLGTVGGWSVAGPAGGSIGGNLASKFF